MSINEALETIKMAVRSARYLSSFPSFHPLGKMPTLVSMKNPLNHLIRLLKQFAGIFKNSAGNSIYLDTTRHLMTRS